MILHLLSIVNMLLKNSKTEIVDKLLVCQWSPFPYVRGLAPGIYILGLSVGNFQTAAAFVVSLSGNGPCSSHCLFVCLQFQRTISISWEKGQMFYIINFIIYSFLICWFFCYWSGSVQFNRSVMSDSLRPHGLQYARLPCPPPTPGACSNSCPLRQ